MHLLRRFVAVSKQWLKKGPHATTEYVASVWSVVQFSAINTISPIVILMSLLLNVPMNLMNLLPASTAESTDQAGEPSAEYNRSALNL